MRRLGIPSGQTDALRIVDDDFTPAATHIVRAHVRMHHCATPCSPSLSPSSAGDDGDRREEDGREPYRGDCQDGAHLRKVIVAQGEFNAYDASSLAARPPPV